MRLSLAIGALTFYPISWSMRLALHAGFDGVEVLCTPWVLARGPERIVRLAESIGMPVLSVHAPLRFRESDSEILARDAGLAMEFAAGIPTCRVVTVHHPLTREGTAAELNKWLTGLRNHQDRFAGADLTISIENRPHNNDDVPNQAIDQPRVLRSLVSEWDFGITFDVAHAASMELPLGNTLREWSRHINNVHLSDAKERQLRGGLPNGFFRDHQLPGAGVLPIPDIVRFLAAAKYQGPLTLELNPITIGAWCPPVAVRRLSRCVDLVRAHIAAAEGAALPATGSGASRRD